jgi:hypothetical protein
MEKPDPAAGVGVDADYEEREPVDDVTSPSENEDGESSVSSSLDDVMEKVARCETMLEKLLAMTTDIHNKLYSAPSTVAQALVAAETPALSAAKPPPLITSIRASPGERSGRRASVAALSDDSSDNDRSDSPSPERRRSSDKKTKHRSADRKSSKSEKHKDRKSTEKKHREVSKTDEKRKSRSSRKSRE